MNLTKGEPKVISQEVPYTGSSDHFGIEVKTQDSNGQVQQINGSASKKTDLSASKLVVSTFSKWIVGQINVQFNDDLTSDEQAELLEAYNDIISQLK